MARSRVINENLAASGSLEGVVGRGGTGVCDAHQFVFRLSCHRGGAGPTKSFDLCIEDGEFRFNSSSRQQSVVVEEIVLE